VPVAFLSRVPSHLLADGALVPPHDSGDLVATIATIDTLIPCYHFRLASARKSGYALSWLSACKTLCIFYVSAHEGRISPRGRFQNFRFYTGRLRARFLLQGGL
jgi:hypothetical protein